MVLGSGLGVGEDGLDDGASLLASGTEDDDGLLSHGGCGFGGGVGGSSSWFGR